jgi:hypothetical protein
MVVRKQDAQRGHDGPARGSRATSSVPPRVPALTVSVPPSSMARSVIAVSPTPGRIWTHTRPVVFDGHLELAAARVAELRLAVRGARVPRGVRHRLDGDAIHGDLDGGGELGQRDGNRYVDRQALPAGGNPRRVFLHRFHQTEFVERGGRRSWAIRRISVMLRHVLLRRTNTRSPSAILPGSRRGSGAAPDEGSGTYEGDDLPVLPALARRGPHRSGTSAPPVDAGRP